MNGDFVKDNEEESKNVHHDQINMIQNILLTKIWRKKILIMQ